MDIAAIVIGRKGSRLKDKNVRLVVGRPLVAYPLMAAKASKYVNGIYVSTDCPQITAVARDFGAELIERPPEMATNEALAEDVFKYCAEKISLKSKPELFVLLFANGATITPGVLDQGIERLLADPTIDSAVTVSPYNMFSPLRARKLEHGWVRPFVDPESFPGATCDRDSQGQTYFADCSAFVVRPRCFDYSKGEVPFRWIGKKVAPLHQEVGFDVDFEWQFPVVEYFLRKNGFTESTTPYVKGF